MTRNTLKTLTLACCLVPAGFGGTIQLIQNGDFENGTTSSWTASTTTFATTTGSCNNGFAAQSAGTGCVTGTNPAFGTYAAYSSTSLPLDLTGTGEFFNQLSQNFTVPASFTSLTLTWYDTATWGGSGTFHGADVLVSIYAGSTFVSNYSTLTNPNNSGSLPWTQHTWDLSSILAAYAGQTLTLNLTEIAFIDTRSVDINSSGTTLIAGFDNVSLAATTASDVPEPGTFVMAGLGLLGAYAVRRQRRRSQRPAR